MLFGETLLGETSFGGNVVWGMGIQGNVVRGNVVRGNVVRGNIVWGMGVRGTDIVPNLLFQVFSAFAFRSRIAHCALLRPLGSVKWFDVWLIRISVLSQTLKRGHCRYFYKGAEIFVATDSVNEFISDRSGHVLNLRSP
jgi:hypothetical protein